MRQAIHVKFLGPTNARDSRYVARAQAGSKTVSADHSLDPSKNAAAAAKALCEKLGWTGELCGGGMPDGTYVFVFC